MLVRGACETVYSGISASPSLDLKEVRVSTRVRMCLSEINLHE